MRRSPEHLRILIGRHSSGGCKWAWPIADLELYDEWRRLIVDHGVSGKKSHDARLVAAMKVHGITQIVTFNTDDFTRYSGIDVIHPAKL